VPRGLGRLALAVAFVAASAAPISALLAASMERPTSAQKRCAAAERRVTRHREGLGAIDARLIADRAARGTCTTPRTCQRLDREIKSEEARHARIARQLAQYEEEQERICAAAPPTAPPAPPPDPAR
jgi:predicted  nucleic acid-binding Zn-ribbon protein